MSARKIDRNLMAEQPASTQRLTLPADAVCIRKNGIEFRNDKPITTWTEMTVTLEGPKPAKKVNFTGVIVACSPSQPQGYTISMLFTQASRLAQARLLGYS